MHRREVEALHVVQRDGRVDEEAEEACADEVPEGDGHEEVNRPLVCADPWTLSGPTRQANVLPRLEADKNQWHHFESAEDCAECQNGVGRSCEI